MSDLENNQFIKRQTLISPDCITAALDPRSAAGPLGVAWVWQCCGRKELRTWAENFVTWLESFHAWPESFDMLLKCVTREL